MTSMNDNLLQEPNANPTTKPSFEEMMAKIESMLSDMEGQKLTLEEQVRNYEQGMNLIAECSRCLTEARNRIAEVYNASPAGRERALRERNFAPEATDLGDKAAR